MASEPAWQWQTDSRSRQDWPPRLVRGSRNYDHTTADDWDFEDEPNASVNSTEAQPSED